MLRRTVMSRLGLYLGYSPEGGGTFQYAQSVLAAMAALPSTRYELVVAYSHPAWPSNLTPFGERLRTIAVRRSAFDKVGRLGRNFGLPALGWRCIARHLPTMEKQLAQLDCSCWIFPAQDYLAFTVSTSTVGTIHDLMHRYEPGFPEVGTRRIQRHREYLYRNMCRFARGILVDSDLGKQQVIESYGVASDRVHVLPFAAPSYILSESVPDDFDIRYALPDSYIFYPAQMWQHKNHVRLIKALAAIDEELPDLHLVLSGSNQNAMPAIEGAIRALELGDKVHLLGYVPDAYMGEVYRRSKGLVMPTFFGPTNIPPLEAMATGCPMAISNVYAMHEQSSDAALYFDPASVEEIAQSIRVLVSNDAIRHRLVEAGSKRLDAYTQAAFNVRFHEFIRQMMQPESGAVRNEDMAPQPDGTGRTA